MTLQLTSTFCIFISAVPPLNITIFIDHMKSQKITGSQFNLIQFKSKIDSHNYEFTKSKDRVKLHSKLC